MIKEMIKNMNSDTYLLKYDNYLTITFELMPKQLAPK